MTCSCDSYECLEVIYNPCSEGAQLNIVANETGNWSADVYFNGMPTQIEFAVTTGDKIIIPVTVLNEYYTHEFRLYNTAGNLIDCYQLKALASKNAGEFTPVPPSGTGGSFVQIFKMGTNVPDTLNTSFGPVITINNGDKIQSSVLVGATLLDVQQVGTSLQPVDGIFGIEGWDSPAGEIDLGQPYQDTYFKVIYTKNS